VTSNKKTPPQQLHQPVLLEQTLSLLAPKQGETYLDLTAGYGGHAREVIGHIGVATLATLVDRDDFAIQHLQDLADQGARIIKNDYASAVRVLANRGEQFDMILIDLGVSSPQLDNQDRGFSIVRSGPLDMRMDQAQPETAADLVNSASEERLVSILRDYGEEPKARAIAREIIAARPITTTDELAEVVKKAYRGKWTRVHPATRTFQAIRIALNDELGQIEQALPLLPRILRPGGRVVIISFHSLEDRLVKRFFKEQAESGYEAELQLLTKHPVSGATEDVHNPRARSAKLRAAVKK
jgi:16S rRNA (cytosine1402-N4)-methyltransferase